MISTIIGVCTKLATYGAVVSGVRIGTNIAGAALERFESTRGFAPTVAGFGDTITNVLDPLDITGTRKKKEDKRKAELAAAQTSAKAKEKLRKDEIKKRKAAEKEAKKLKKALKAAEAKAAASEKKAEKAEKAGKAKEADFYKKQAAAAERWARTAQATAARSAKASSPDQQLALLTAAVGIAQNGANPPMSAVEAASRQTTESGKAIALSMTDSINRDEEPDYEELAEGLDRGDSDAYEDLIDAAISGVEDTSDDEAVSFWGSVAGDDSDSDEESESELVAGPCCASCAGSPAGSSCGSGGCGKSVPFDLVDGTATGAGLSDHGRSFWEVDGADDGSDDYDTSGPDDDDDDDNEVSGPFDDDLLAEMVISGPPTTNEYDGEDDGEEERY